MKKEIMKNEHSLRKRRDSISWVCLTLLMVIFWLSQSLAAQESQSLLSPASHIPTMLWKRIEMKIDEMDTVVRQEDWIAIDGKIEVISAEVTELAEIIVLRNKHNELITEWMKNHSKHIIALKRPLKAAVEKRDIIFLRQYLSVFFGMIKKIEGLCAKDTSQFVSHFIKRQN